MYEPVSMALYAAEPIAISKLVVPDKLRKSVMLLLAYCTNSFDDICVPHTFISVCEVPVTFCPVVGP